MESRHRARRACQTVAAMLVVSAGVVEAQPSTSAPVARELSQAMTSRQLTTFATADPQRPDEYVAVMFFPDVQLLVVAGRPLDPAGAKWQAEGKDHAGLYATLQQAVVPESKMFVQDLKADGLAARAKDTVDIVYDKVVNQLIFDGDPGKRRLSDAKYVEQFNAEDARYRRLLEVLLAALKSAPGPSSF
jgi:hypothetical protein